MKNTNHDILNAAQPETWARAEHLLPGYLKKTLSTPDQAWMEVWINQTQIAGGPVAAALTSELAWVRGAQETLGQQALAFNTQNGWHKLQATLQNELTVKNNMGASPGTSAPALATQAAISPPAPSLLRQIKLWLAKLARMQKDRALHWWQKPAVAALASAMVIGQMGFLAAAVKQVHTLTTDASMVTPSSGASRPTDGVVLKVVFKPKASMQDIMASLNRVKGRVVGGPGALGIWEVEVPTDQLLNAVQTLGKSKTVESVTQE